MRATSRSAISANRSCDALESSGATSYCSKRMRRGEGPSSTWARPTRSVRGQGPTLASPAPRKCSSRKTSPVVVQTR